MDIRIPHSVQKPWFVGSVCFCGLVEPSQCPPGKPPSPESQALSPEATRHYADITTQNYGLHTVLSHSLSLSLSFAFSFSFPFFLFLSHTCTCTSYIRIEILAQWLSRQSLYQQSETSSHEGLESLRIGQDRCQFPDQVGTWIRLAV